MERKRRRRRSRRRWRWRSGAVNETETLGKDDKRNVKSKKQKGRRNKSVCGSGGGRGIYQMERPRRLTIWRVDEEKRNPQEKERARPEEIKMTGDKGDRTEIERYGNTPDG